MENLRAESNLTGLYDKNGRGGSIPLKSVDVKGKIVGSFADITIRQVYVNGGRNAIEAVYTFPLPDSASVYGFKAVMNGRKINGDIMEKEEAIKRYDGALTGGNSAFLLEQHRPDVFQLSAGQIGPGEQVEIEISYIDELKETDNELRLSIPTVVAPRYIPGKRAGARVGTGTADPTDRVPDADFITPPIGHADYRVTFKIEVDPMRKISSYESPSHNIRVETLEPSGAIVSLANDTDRLDRDFILKMRLKSEGSSYSMAADGRNGEGIIYASFVPEITPSADEADMDYIFLLDISGSMDGIKLEQAKNALKVCLRNLNVNDSFNIAAFESSCHYMVPEGSLHYNQENLTLATAWIDGLQAMGGTEILEAVKFGLSFASRTGPRTIVLFTDGQVGNEDEIIRYVRDNRGQSRMFTLGIDTSVNAGFINSLAAVGGGKPEFVYPGERIDDKVVRQFARMVSPQARDIKIDWGGIKAEDVVPDRITSLFDMEFVCFIAKYKDSSLEDIKLSGKTGDTVSSWTIDRDDIREGDWRLLSRLWARSRIRQLEESLGNGNPRRDENIKREIISISKEYGIMSRYTAFTAVLEREDKIQGMPVTQTVPVLFPAAWELRPVMRSSTYLSAPMAARSSECISESFECFSMKSPEPAHGSELPGFLRKGYSARRAGMSFRQQINRLANHKSAVSSLEASELLRILARNQQAYGEFCNSGENITLRKVEVTANAITAFSLFKGSIEPYRRQLEKSLHFIKAETERWIKGDTETGEIGAYLPKLVLAMKASLLKEAYGVLAKKKAEELLSDILLLAKSEIVPDPRIKQLLECKEIASLKQKKALVLELTGLEAANVGKLEKLLSGTFNEADSIDKVVALCILLNVGM